MAKKKHGPSDEIVFIPKKSSCLIFSNIFLHLSEKEKKRNLEHGAGEAYD